VLHWDERPSWFGAFSVFLTCSFLLLAEEEAASGERRISWTPLNMFWLEALKAAMCWVKKLWADSNWPLIWLLPSPLFCMVSFSFWLLWDLLQAV